MADDAAPVDLPPSPPRIGYCLIQAASLSVFSALCWTAVKYQAVYDQLGMTMLPAPTALLLAVGKLISSPPGMFIIPVLGVLLIVLALKGKLDPYLRKLITINILWALLMIPFGYLSLHMPIAQIEETLRNK
jgi:hypothetical protein